MSEPATTLHVERDRDHQLTNLLLAIATVLLLAIFVTLLVGVVDDDDYPDNWPARMQAPTAMQGPVGLTA